MSQKVPIDSFKWMEGASEFNKHFIYTFQTIMKIVLKYIFWKLKAHSQV